MAILVLVNKSENYLDSNGIETKYQSPVVRWKELIGNKDPALAKNFNPNSFRGLYGTDLTHNEFWGSDSPSDAYRELSNFLLPLPSRAPEFSYDINKLELKTLMNFLFPIKPNHPDVSGRMDIFSKYGPVTNNHILDTCICKDCRPKIKNILLEEGKALKSAKDKVLSEEFLNRNIKNFCHLCLQHFNCWSHLFTGFEQTHIMTNEEINFLILEMNKEDLMTILLSEKGSCASTILAKIDIKILPQQIQYTRQHVEKLLTHLDVDFYDRYDYKELQNLINEDRRIRMNFWVSKIIGKPPSSFLNPKLINSGLFTDEDIKDIKCLQSKNFTLLRHLPIKVKNEKEEKLNNLIIQHPIFLKEKLTDHEIKNKLEKLVTKEYFHITQLEDSNNSQAINNLLILRNYKLETMKEKEYQKKLKILKNKIK